MGGARALIASLGASVSLVAGAAMSLLLFSLVFALPGLTGGGDPPRASAAVDVKAKPARPAPRAQARGASSSVLIRAPKAARAAARPGEQRASVGRREPVADKPLLNPDLRDLTPPPPEAPTAGKTPAKPTIGDGVRDVGDVVTATVQGTAAAAAPLLGPPVSQAVQDVLDLLTSVLQGATGALGGVLDTAVAPRGPTG
jgi:hypothetical protein